MKLLIFSILTALIAACGNSNIETEKFYSPKSALVDEISRQVFKQLLAEKKLIPIECGGRMMDQIKLLHWGFFYYKEIDINESRELLLNTANRFLEAFNADERIRPYLATYPFTPQHILVNIFLKDSDGSELGPNKLHVISLNEGVLDYMIQGVENPHLETILLESYAEAEAKLNAHVSKAE